MGWHRTVWTCYRHGYFLLRVMQQKGVGFLAGLAVLLREGNGFRRSIGMEIRVISILRRSSKYFPALGICLTSVN